MNFQPCLVRFVVLLIAGACTIGQVHAQTCSVSAAPVDFGVYDPFASASNDSTGSVSVTCQAAASLLVTYSIRLNGGGGGNAFARKMIYRGSQMMYQVYTDVMRTIIWGSGSGGSGVVTGSYVLSALVPISNTYTAYGRITAQQVVEPGAYQDTLTVVVSY